MTTEIGTTPAALPANDEIPFIEILNALLRNWRTVVILPVLLGLLFGVRALTSQRTYVATSSFVPQTGESRGLDGAAALAKQFGVSLGSERSGQSPQFYEDLLRTRNILRRAVESQYQMKSPTGQSQPLTLIEYWKLSEKDDPTTPVWRRGADSLRSSIATSVRRETGVIELTVTMKDGNLAEQVAERLLELLNDYNLEVRQRRAREEGRFVGGRLADVLRDLGVAEDALERFLRNNRDFRSSPELTFEHDRLQRIVSAQQQLYATLLAAQEQARMDGMRETPILQTIDSPIGSVQPASRKVALRAVVGFLLGILVAIAIAMTRQFMRRGRQDLDPAYLEFESLLGQAKGDVRRLRGWFGGANRTMEEREGGGE